MSVINPLDHVEGMTRRANDYMGKQSRSVLGRYPVLFSLLTAFGVVSILHGFDSFIEYMPFLADRPLLVFFLGIIILVVTGTLYKKLGHRKLD